VIYSWKNIVKHSLPLLTVCIFIEIFAGQILQGKQEMLVLFPVFLISIPVINGVGGNIGSVLGARLASGLHVGSHPLIPAENLVFTHYRIKHYAFRPFFALLKKVSQFVVYYYPNIAQQQLCIKNKGF